VTAMRAMAAVRAMSAVVVVRVGVVRVRHADGMRRGFRGSLETKERGRAPRGVTAVSGRGKERGKGPREVPKPFLAANVLL
jgi:hypothetical protein